MQWFSQLQGVITLLATFQEKFSPICGVMINCVIRESESGNVLQGGTAILDQYHTRHNTEVLDQKLLGSHKIS